jgi:transcriptional regulator with AAA-type ATPase domain
MLTVKDLFSINIFNDFAPGKLAAIIPQLNEKTFTAGTTIIYRGDPGYSMFMILEGSVAVTLRNDENIEYTLSTLEQGGVFGEMALMTGEPRSANIKAITNVRLAELCQDVFFNLITEYPKLNENLFHLIAQRRARTTARWHFINLEREEIISNIFARQPLDIDHFLGKSQFANEINAEINRLAFLEKHVLVLGERGIGKKLAARLIHSRNPSRVHRLLHLDCADPPPIERELRQRRTEEKDALYLEVAQESALFGHGADAGIYAKGIRRGHIELADGGTIVLENIESLSPLVQRLLVEYLKEGKFTRKGENQRISSNVRLISTSSRSLEEIREQKKIHPDLLELVGQEILYIRPLRERKKDIPIIADHFLGEYNKKFAKRITGFSEDAVNDLVDHDWPLNVNELRQVIERAVAIADDDTIRSSQVFLNPSAFSAKGRFNLLRVPLLRNLFLHPLFPKGLQMITVPFILGLIVFTIIGPGEKNPANLLVWTIWWPVLIFSIVIGARSWCGYCPLPVISDGFNFFRKKFFSVPGFLERNGVWISICGIAVIFLAEHATSMFTAAHATGILLLTILMGTLITNFFLGKRAWCKHLCPLGKIVAHFSVLSLIELGSNTNVCSSQCETHECVTTRSCPMGLHPAIAATSKDCVFCLSCAKICKHRSVRVDIRLPWQGFSIPKKWDIPTAFFAVLLTALILSVSLPLRSYLPSFLPQVLSRSSFFIDVVAPVTITLVFIAMVLFASGFPYNPSWLQYYSISGYAYLFLAFAGFFNIYYHEFVHQSYNILPWTVDIIGLGGMIPKELITPDLGILKVIIPLVTLFGSITSLFILRHLGEKYAIPVSVRYAQQAIILITTLFYFIIL